MEKDLQSKRVLAIDLARGASVPFIVVIHTLWMYGTVETQTETMLGEIIHFIGKGTPMFLLAMGFSFCLSSKQDVPAIIKRGLELLAIGYGMNLFKFIVPYLLGLLPDNFIAAYTWEAPLSFDQLLYLLQTGDILQLAGISVLLMLLIQCFSTSKYVPAILALIFAIAAPFVRGIHLGMGGVDYVLDLLWGTGWNVYFPAFPWAAFILFGMFLGRWYIEKAYNQAFIFKQMFMLGIISMIIGGGLMYYDYDFHFNDFFHLGTGGTIYLAGFTCLLFCIAYFVGQRFPSNKFFDFLCYSSKRVTHLYVAQWVVISWGMSIFGYQQHDPGGIVMILPLAFITTYVLQFFYENIIEKRTWFKRLPLLKNNKIAPNTA